MSNYDDCDYPMPAPALRAAHAQSQAAKAAEMKAKAVSDARREQQVLYLTLLAQGGAGGPVTEVTMPVNGDFIEADYKALFTNNTNNPVRVQVFADLVTPGCGAILSLTRDRSDVGKYDVLSLTANGRVESVTTIVLPTYSIWARDFDAAVFPMQVVDTLRVRVFDPAKLISYGNLYPELQRNY